MDDTILSAKELLYLLTQAAIAFKRKLKRLWLRGAHLSAIQIQDV